jgi:hypothetical protein
MIEKWFTLNLTLSLTFYASHAGWVLQLSLQSCVGFQHSAELVYSRIP